MKMNMLEMLGFDEKTFRANLESITGEFMRQLQGEFAKIHARLDSIEGQLNEQRNGNGRAARIDAIAGTVGEPVAKLNDSKYTN